VWRSLIGKPFAIFEQYTLGDYLDHRIKMKTNLGAVGLDMKMEDFFEARLDVVGCLY